MTVEQLELLNIIKKVLRGGELPEIDQSLDFTKLYNIAKANSVANTVADVFCQSNNVPNNIKRLFQNQKTIIVAQQINCDYCLQTLYKELDEKNIRGIFLKGTLLRGIYPVPFIRSMSDIDVYARESDMESIHSMMINLGYESETIGQGNHYEYMQGRMVKVEYHPELVALDSDYGKSVFKKKHPDAPSIAFHMDIWNHTIPIEDHEYARQLVPEYHYVYVIMHMMNHFLTAGTGIRSVMDVWMMNQYYHNTWNRCEIDALLSDYGLATFEKYALALADKWFDLSGLPYLPDAVDDAVLKLYESYILQSGTYGSTEHSVTRQMNHETGRLSKCKYLLSRFFLPYRQMKEIYPVLKKVPILLPALWPYRVIEMFQKRGQSAKYKLKTVAKADSTKVSKQKELIEAIMQ